LKISIAARKYWLAGLAAAIIYGAMTLVDNELITHHLRAEARYLDYFVLALVAFIFVLVLEDFHERESRRLQDVERLVVDMNHHVRNALQVISYANATNTGGRFTTEVRESVQRIDWALREVLGERAAKLGVQPLTRPPDWPGPPGRLDNAVEPRIPISEERGQS
jgi:hypothetical protein